MNCIHQVVLIQQFILIKTIDVNGNGIFTFPSTILNTSYYLVVKHRNSIETWSGTPFLFSNSSVFYNFSDAASKAFGNNLKFLATGVFGIYSGDVDKNGSINLVDLSLVENNTATFLRGYVSTDVTGNGIVESTDQSVVENNIDINLMRP